MFSRPCTPTPAGDRLGGQPDPLELGRRQRHRRQGARRVAGVDAGLLDVLHDAAEEQLGAVEQGVDVDLDGVVEEAVDEQRRERPGASSVRGVVERALDVLVQLRLVVDDLHAAAAEHVDGRTRTGKPIRRAVSRAPACVVRGAERGGRQPGGLEDLAELAAVLGGVDRLRATCRGSAARRRRGAARATAASGRRACTMRPSTGPGRELRRGRPRARPRTSAARSRGGRRCRSRSRRSRGCS